MGYVIKCETFKDDEDFDKLNLKIRITPKDIDLICKSLKEDNDVTIETKNWIIDITI